MNLPNKLTIFRIILVPVLVIIPLFSIKGEFFGIPTTFWIMNIIFIIASITDSLDGYIARSRNQITTFGKFLDPIADKVLVVAVLIILVGMAKIPSWIPIIVIIREFIVSGYRLVAVEKDGEVIAASMWGKMKTTTQMIAIILALLDVNAFGAFINQSITGFAWGLNVMATTMMLISVIATIFSGWDYVKHGKELFKGES